MLDLPTRPLAQLCGSGRSICYGIVQPGQPNAAGVPIVRVNNFRDHRLDLTDVLCVDPAIEARFARSRPRPGDILVTLVGTVGQVAIAPQMISGWNVARAVGVIPAADRHHAEWIYFALQTQEAQRFIQRHANTTVQTTFNLRDLAALPIPYPDKRQREVVLSILLTLQNKIELNRRMNETLEAMARAIFRDWFIDFGPSRRKLAGITNPIAVMGGIFTDDGRAAGLAAIFPDALSDESLPVGWEERPLLELCELKRGYDLPTRDRTSGSIPIVSSSGATGWHSRAMVKGPGIVTGRYGTIGEVHRVSSDFWPLNTTLYVRNFKGHPYWFVYFVMAGFNFFKFADKAAVPGINRNDLHRDPVVFPPHSTMASFHELVAMIMAKVQENERENAALVSTLDLLLPKLMSGEISPGDRRTAVRGQA